MSRKGNTIHLSDHFDYVKLLCFTMPSIAMMVFMSIYGVVDGFFVSNYVGKTAFAGVNFIMPVLMILTTLGFMLGTGGSALVGIRLGENKRDEANALFSMFVYTSIVCGVVICLAGMVLLKPIAVLMGAEGEMLDYCVRYGRLILVFIPASMLQMEFQSFVITSEKPNLGFAFTVGAGITNMFLDWFLVGMLNLGVEGAAFATGLSQTVGGFGPFLYYLRPNTSLLRLGKTRFNGKALWQACVNGSSEFMSNISMSLVSIMYNLQLMKYAGENGVSAYGVLMYVCFIFISAFVGYAIGTAPVVSYHFGAGNKDELHNILKRSFVLISVFAILMLGFSELMAMPLSKLYVGYDEELTALTCRGFRFFGVSFLFTGFAVYSSSFFTALGDGITSAIISFLRTLLFQIVAVFLFPLIFGIDGIWISLVASEMMAVIVGIAFLAGKQKRFGY